MRTHRRSDGLVLAAAFVALAAVAVVVARGQHSQPHPAPTFTWRGIVGDIRPPVSLGQRMIVVLRAPSLAERLATAGATTKAQERRWTTQVYAAQNQVLTMLSAHGLGVHPDYTFARVLDGFSAALDPRAVALLDDDPRVAGIYPVRAAFPASLSTQRIHDASLVRQAQIALPGFDGRGVTIALLDTGVDRSQPYLHGRVSAGVDVVGRGSSAAALTDPQDPSRREQHGTELAGLIVGAGGPVGLHGIATAANLLPIRVAGWQPDASGHDVVYSRSDQVIAGLESAVDPNGDGDTHDAARIAVLGVAEPYAAFADAPEARAVAGAMALNTLVVVPAGNDGVAGPGFGSISGPGGAPAALTVGASDGRSTTPAARVVLRRGLQVVYDTSLPVLGTVAPTHGVDLAVGVPNGTRTAVPSLRDFFDRRGLSFVAGKAALVSGGDDPAAAAAAAAAAGASAVIVYGAALPAGPLDLPSEVDVPVVGIPAGPALALLAARKLGIDVGISLGDVRTDTNQRGGSVAVFSSRGLSFDGRVKPDMIAPGVGLATSNVGVTTDGEPAFATVNGTSAAAASVAGAAALLAQARPGLDATALKSLLAGYAQRIGGAPVTEQGAGTLNIGLSAVGEVAAAPTSLAFGRWTGPAWRSTQTIVVRNVSSRRLSVATSAVVHGGAGALRLRVVPRHIALGVGREAMVTVSARSRSRPAARLASGVIRLAPDGGQTLHVPWAIDFGRPAGPLLTKITLRESSFSPSDVRPALLDLQVGRIATTGAIQIQPVSRLEIALYDGGGKLLGLLTRQRDLLPGSYRFALTGRGPSSATLAPGRYELRLTAWPTVPGAPSRAIVRFTIR